MKDATVKGVESHARGGAVMPGGLGCAVQDLPEAREAGAYSLPGAYAAPTRRARAAEALGESQEVARGRFGSLLLEALDSVLSEGSPPHPLSYEHQ